MHSIYLTFLNITADLSELQTYIGPLETYISPEVDGTS